MAKLDGILLASYSVHRSPAGPVGKTIDTDARAATDALDLLRAEGGFVGGDEAW